MKTIEVTLYKVLVKENGVKVIWEDVPLNVYTQLKNNEFKNVEFLGLLETKNKEVSVLYDLLYALSKVKV